MALSTYSTASVNSQINHENTVAIVGLKGGVCDNCIAVLKKAGFTPISYDDQDGVPIGMELCQTIEDIRRFLVKKDKVYLVRQLLTGV